LTLPKRLATKSCLPFWFINQHVPVEVAAYTDVAEPPIRIISWQNEADNQSLQDALANLFDHIPVI
jgi:hypothetical protein